MNRTRSPGLGLGLVKTYTTPMVPLHKTGITAEKNTRTINSDNTTTNNF